MNTNMNMDQLNNLLGVRLNLTAEQQKLITEAGMGITVAILVVALLNCFFGLKLIRIWSGLIGFLIGFCAGAAIASQFVSSSAIVLAIGGAAGVIMAILGFWLFRVGVFIISWLLGVAIVFSFFPSADMVMLLVGAVVGLVLAVLSIKFLEPIIIFLTGIHGGLTAAGYIVALISIPWSFAEYAIGAVLSILGIVVQFIMESHRKVKQHVAKANKVREEISTENEVDRARSLLDDVDRVEADKDADDYYDEDDDDEISRKVEEDEDDDDDIQYID